MRKTRRISFRLGTLKFRCEGSAKWVASQFDKVLNHIASDVHQNAGASSKRTIPAIESVEADVTDYPCDILVLKHAQGFFGADLAIAQRLAKSSDLGIESFNLQPGQYRHYDSNGAIAARKVLFIGTSPLVSFGYDQIFALAQRGIRAASQIARKGGSIAMTIHGIGCGLNEQDLFQAQLSGICAAWSAPDVNAAIRKVSIVERNPERAYRLRCQLERFFAGG